MLVDTSPSIRMFQLFKLLARDYGWLVLLAVPAALVAHHYFTRLPRLARSAWVAASAVLVMALIAVAVVIMAHNYEQPPQWDFQLYWVFGRAAVTGRNPYDVQALREIATSVPFSDELLGETVFLHPPPTLFLFAPLGWFDMRTSCLLWQVFHATLLIVSILWLWRAFFPDADWTALLLVALLTLMLRSTLETVRFTQVNFLSLALFLGVWQWRSKVLGGVLLGLALIVKPVFFLIPLYLLARGHLRAIVGVAITAVATSAASVLVFGWEMFLGYFRANPLSRDLPHYFYTEWINQSLLATSLRLTGQDLAVHGPYSNPLFWTGAAIFAAVSAWTIWRLPRDRDDWALAIALVLSLLLFPKTLSHYGVLLLPPLLLVWSRRDRLPFAAWTASLVIGTVYLLVGTQQLLPALIVLWLTLIAVTGRLKEPTEVSRPAKRDD